MGTTQLRLLLGQCVVEIQPTFAEKKENEGRDKICTSQSFYWLWHYYDALQEMKIIEANDRFHLYILSIMVVECRNANKNSFLDAGKFSSANGSLWKKKFFRPSINFITLVYSSEILMITQINENRDSLCVALK